jgi:hypothetical protein
MSDTRTIPDTQAVRELTPKELGAVAGGGKGRGKGAETSVAEDSGLPIVGGLIGGK